MTHVKDSPLTLNTEIVVSFPWKIIPLSSFMAPTFPPCLFSQQPLLLPLSLWSTAITILDEHGA